MGQPFFINEGYSSLFYPSDNLENYLLEFHDGNLIGITSDFQINMDVLTSFQYGIQKNCMSLSIYPGLLLFQLDKLEDLLQKFFGFLKIYFAIEVFDMSCMVCL